MEHNLQNREVAVKLTGVKKMYKLGQIGGGTLHGDLESWWARIRGKEDPNTVIGTSQRLVGRTFMALNGIDLTIYQGEAVGIIGGNGAGKSTMLKLLSRVTAPTEGEIDIYGRIASMLEVGTGFHGELTGRENVYMNGAILGMTKAEIDAKMEDIIEFSEVRDFIDTPVKRYSSGMYVKLAFSVAAHLDSEIMIMDEVLAVGDMAFQKKCLTKMKDAAKKEGRTVLYVSHNMNTIRQLCDRCIVLSKGKVVYEGDVESSIAVYMDSEANDQVKMDFSDAVRPDWLYCQKVLLKKASFVDKESNIFGIREPVPIQLEWENLVDVKELCLRVEAISLEGNPVGTYTVYDFYQGKQGESGRAVVTLDTSALTEATYRLRFTFFIKDVMGNNLNIDWAEGLCFSKTSFDEEEKLVWDAVSWGYIHLPDPDVKVI
ncbi:MAG: ABC transporter ATP-binding protein [Oscillospiraceae bacterium]|nr:ABC transporter ATP-binding protein [Oscillospiraceae bacterium]